MQALNPTVLQNWPLVKLTAFVLLRQHLQFSPRKLKNMLKSTFQAHPLHQVLSARRKPLPETHIHPPLHKIRVYIHPYPPQTNLLKPTHCLTSQISTSSFIDQEQLQCLHCPRPLSNILPSTTLPLFPPVNSLLEISLNSNNTVKLSLPTQKEELPITRK